MIECTVGIMAYNEERNIDQLLDALLRQQMKVGFIKKIVVVASGCTDRTVEIVKKFTAKYAVISLIVQPEREGKSSAINLFLKTVTTPVVVLESADTLPLFYTIEELVKPFTDQNIGIAGGHPLPQDDPDTFLGFTNHLLWTLHHLLSLERPKMGEIIAFRNIVSSIPAESAVDETSIEAFFYEKKMEILYLPKAIALNKGAGNVFDFLKQRRRIYAGHIYIEKKYGYHVSTFSALKIFKLILTNIKLNYKTVFWLAGTIGLEALGRYLGFYDYFLRKKNHAIWEIATTTKEVIKNN